jgi:Carboxypeptidase regulatory-like domain
MKHGFFGAAAGVVGFALLFTPSLSAQQLATLSVTVRDPSGRVISQARISLHNVDTGAKRTDWSSGTGVAVIPGLPAGSYQLTIESDQFSSDQAPLTLTVGHIASVSATLGVATAKQEVDVEDTV